MNIEGKCIIFSSDKGYSTSISKKNQDGEYERMYLAVQLPKGDELENKTQIIILDGFLSFYKTKDGLPKPKIVIMKYKKQEEQDKEIENSDIFSVTPEDLPF